MFGAILILVLGATLWFSYSSSSQIVLTQAKITPMGNDSFMVTVDMENAGSADILLSIDASGFRHSHFMGTTKTVVLPGNSKPSLSEDGTHIMVQSDKEFAPGQLLPISLIFQNAGAVTARAKLSEAIMDHSTAGGEQTDASIELKISKSDQQGVIGQINVSGLELTTIEPGTPHVPRQGHAHLYLNGLKLGRLFKEEFEIGPLLPGTYEIRVSLNTNDHRSYIHDGKAVSAGLSFSIE
jgi:copper(I)-binding protein